MARKFTIKPPEPSPGDHRADWIVNVPPCGRCGALHWGEWMTRLVDGSWVGDGCLTPEEAAKWIRAEERPTGKVAVPVH